MLKKFPTKITRIRFKGFVLRLYQISGKPLEITLFLDENFFIVKNCPKFFALKIFFQTLKNKQVIKMFQYLTNLLGFYIVILKQNGNYNKGFHIVISEIQHSYGDGYFSHITPNSRAKHS